MPDKLIFLDGAKAANVGNLLESDDPTVWTYFSGEPAADDVKLYARVAAAFRAYNLKANTISNMPFAIVDKSGKDFDTSASWENKLGFLPNPSELFRLNTLSYIATNTIYVIRGMNATMDRSRPQRTKSLRPAVAYTFNPVTNSQTGELMRVERWVGGEPEIYAPDDPRLIRMWRLDHTTEVLPSLATEAKAIMTAAGELHYADIWIENFYRRGGIKPTLIAMKGMVNREQRQDEESKWSQWLRGIGKWWTNIARVYNAEALDVKAFGDGVADLENNEVYRQAIANIAMGIGMPLSLLLSNSANYATAKEEKATWFDNDIVPFCNWLAYEYNQQLFQPMGYRLEFRPETIDENQEEEGTKAQAFSVYMDALSKCPTFDVFVGFADTLGLELSDTLRDAAQKYYNDKEKRAEELQARMEPKPENEQPPQLQQAQEDDDEDEEPEEEEQPRQRKATKADDNSSMIALRIPEPIREEIKARYSFVDQETLNNLHITLVFLGDTRSLDKMDIIRAVSDFAQFQAPIKGRLQGLARFVNGTEKDPLVCTFDSPQMPGVYNRITAMLDEYRVPYHKEHGFIPHMTLAYIPKDAEMPVETIEPIEINFSEVNLVDGNSWFPLDLIGYENKSSPAPAGVWQPSIDQLQELKTWRKAAQQRFKRGESLDFDYLPHFGGLPDDVTAAIRAALAVATDAEQIKAAFELPHDEPEPVKAQPEPGELKYLADALIYFADKAVVQST